MSDDPVAWGNLGQTTLNHSAGPPLGSPCPASSTGSGQVNYTTPDGRGRLGCEPGSELGQGITPRTLSAAASNCIKALVSRPADCIGPFICTHTRCAHRRGEVYSLGTLFRNTRSYNPQLRSFPGKWQPDVPNVQPLFPYRSLITMLALATMVPCSTCGNYPAKAAPSQVVTGQVNSVGGSSHCRMLSRLSRGGIGARLC